MVLGGGRAPSLWLGMSSFYWSVLFQPKWKMQVLSIHSNMQELAVMVTKDTYV